MTFRARHLLGIEQLHPLEITTLLDLADTYADHNTRGLAHREVLAAGQKNLAGYDGTRIGFDFAVSESCAQFDECDAYVDDFGDQVLMVEYRLRDFREACRQHGDDVAIVLRDLDLSPDGVHRWC